MPEPSPTRSPASSDSASPARFSTKVRVERSRRGLWKLELGAALLLTTEHFLVALSVMCLLLSSYAWWGSPQSPMAPLWKVAAILYLLTIPMAWVHRRILLSLLRGSHRSVETVLNEPAPAAPTD